MSSLSISSYKPIIYVANVFEDDAAAENNEYVEQVAGLQTVRGPK